MLEFLFINLDVWYLDSELFADDVEFVHLILDIVGDRTYVIFKLAIIKDSQFFVDFIFESVQINGVGFLFEVLFVGLEERLFEIWRDLEFL